MTKRPKCPICKMICYKVRLSSGIYIKRYYCSFCDKIFPEKTILECQEMLSSWSTRNRKIDISKLEMEASK